MKSLKAIPRKMCTVGLKRRRAFSPFFDCTGRRCAFCVPKTACQAQNSVALTTILLYGKVVSGNVHLARYCAPPRFVGVRRCGRIRQRAGQKGGYRGTGVRQKLYRGRYARRRKISERACARCGDERRKNGKHRSLSGTRAFKRLRRALLRLTIRPV